MVDYVVVMLHECYVAIMENSRCVDYLEWCCGMGDVHVIICCLLITMLSFI